MDKSWMTLPERLSNEYIDGVKSTIKVAENVWTKII